ncbi:hypothetical protein PM082_014659 [Marasmius tenuissimus]|nr:hypothetical protein PM082_014659 [Marasmius tenuissimus]
MPMSGDVFERGSSRMYCPLELKLYETSSESTDAEYSAADSVMITIALREKLT